MLATFGDINQGDNQVITATLLHVTEGQFNRDNATISVEAIHLQLQMLFTGCDL